MTKEFKQRWLVLLSALVVSSCGGGGSSTQSVPPPPSGGPTDAERIAAATTTANSNALCNAIEPFYWEIGNETSRMAAGSVGNSAPTASTRMSIASASKWLYGAYVLQRRGGTLSASDIKFLNFRSGYSNFTVPLCPENDTVDECLNRDTNGLYTQSTDGHFVYNSGHMQKHASLMGLGSMNNAALAAELQSQIGNFGFTYGQPQLAGGVHATADNYAGFLRKLLSGGLQLSSRLGANPVCTTPQTCSSADSSPVANATGGSESWDYSLGHWVEDDPNVGDGAFSSPGAFGFYPWVDSSKTYYGIVAREVVQGFYESAQCGRKIRKAWLTGVAQ